MQDGTVETHNITGTLDLQWMIDNGYYIPYDEETGAGDYWAKNITQVDVGNNVTSIGVEAFGYCETLTSVTIPNSVTNIGNEAFIECSSITNVTIPDSVTSIGWNAFFGCSSITSITIPNGVTSIGNGAFAGCSGLMSISVGSGNANYKSVNGLLLSKDGETLIYGVNGEVTIPNSITSIGDDAFRYFSNLTRLTIPDGVMSIGFQAFEGCTNLTSVAIGNSVTSIGGMAFEECSGLTSVTFQGKTLAQVQAMDFYPWRIKDTSIINVA